MEKKNKQNFSEANMENFLIPIPGFLTILAIQYAFLLPLDFLPLMYMGDFRLILKLPFWKIRFAWGNNHIPFKRITEDKLCLQECLHVKMDDKAVGSYFFCFLFFVYKLKEVWKTSSRIFPSKEKRCMFFFFFFFFF